MKQRDKNEIEDDVLLWEAKKKKMLQRVWRGFASDHLRNYQEISDELMNIRKEISACNSENDSHGVRKSRLINKSYRLINELKEWYI